MANRTTVLGGIWALGAPDPPSGTLPAADTTYANSSLDSAAIIAGWPYKKVVDAADYNELMRRMTTLMGLQETYGILPFCASTIYPVGAQVMGADGVVYTSIQAANTNKEPQTETAWWASSRSGQLLAVQIFTTPGTATYTPTAGARNAVVEVVGGGGGGGGTIDTDSTQAKAATGGGAGAYGKKWISGVTSQTVTVGAGGSGGAKTSNGSAGGTSSFGSIITATGGAGGTCPSGSSHGNYNSGSVGGTASGGDINIPGHSSHPSWASSSPDFFAQGSGSNGANSQFGSGGLSRLNANSDAGSGYGAGGGGSSTGASTSGSAGGAGAPGIIIVWEYA
jgi:hypothetical protein